MSDAEADRSPELDRVRRMLFPQLSEAEGWARIDGAIDGAADSQRFAAIERLAKGDLNDDLLSLLRVLRREQPDER